MWEQASIVEQLFRQWDKDGGEKEWRKAMPAMGIRAELSMVDKLFDSFDQDVSGEPDRARLRRRRSRELDDVKLRVTPRLRRRTKSGDISEHGIQPLKLGSTHASIDQLEHSAATVEGNLRPCTTPLPAAVVAAVAAEATVDADQRVQSS